MTPSGHVYVDEDMAKVLGSVSGFSAIERRRRMLRGTLVPRMRPT